MNAILREPSPFDYLEIQEQLDEICSEESFEIIYYGSRERGDYEWNSDFNFYLLASTQDQMKPGFIQRVTQSLKVMERISAVNLIAGDKETFRVRMNLFDPAILHMLEKGIVFYGNHIFHKFQMEWQRMDKTHIPQEKLIPFLKRRRKFYTNLKSRNEKENSIRMERVSTLDIQIWVLENIDDISIPELIVLDMPSLCNRMIRELYRKEWNDEIHHLLVERNRWRIRKREIQSKELGLSQKSYCHF